MKGEIFAKYQMTAAKKCSYCHRLKDHSETIVFKGFYTNKDEKFKKSSGDSGYYKCSKQCETCRYNIPTMRDPLLHKHCYICQVKF